MLVFEERGKPEYPEKNLSEQGREPTTNSTHIRRRIQESNPGHIGGRPAWEVNAQPMRHPCSPNRRRGGLLSGSSIGYHKGGICICMREMGYGLYNL